MNPRLALAALAVLGSSFALAQNVTEEPQPDPVLDAIHDFNERDKQKPNEVTVVLDPVGEPPAALKEEATSTEPAKQPSPVLVTGKPPEEADLTKTPVAEPQNAIAVAPDEEFPKPENGLAVRVEKLHSGTGVMDPAQVKLLAPFPAKPLAAAPAGWHLDASDSAPPFTREVEISPGTKITLTIRPHLLVPDADGASVFTISEPGYDNALGYRQTATVGAILSNSIRQLDDDSKQLGTAIESLQQLLISLPKPEVQPETKPTPIRKR